MAGRHSSWIPVDWAVAIYAAGVGLLALVCARSVAHWPSLVAGHGAILAILLWLPARGARWEHSRPDDPPWRREARRTCRFIRYTYPAILLTPFFEEVRFTVNATSPLDPYWFEPSLYAADQALFDGIPAVALSHLSTPILDEMMHVLYFSYYPLIIGGIVVAWMGPARSAATPGAGFHAALTSMMLGFFFAYVWYPFLPARGPWENRALVSGLPEFHGFLFTPLVQWIIDRAAVSGGCFPSAHVAGSCGLAVGLTAAHRRPAIWLGLLTAGLSVACVYTRYHHAVDVLGGLVVGAAGGALGLAWTRGPRPAACASGPAGV